MKKLLAVALILCLLIPCAIAESVDLSDLSFDELRDLQYRVASEIMSRPEWESVVIPAGSWRIGVDIPAGSYSMESADGKSVFIGVWGYEKGDYITNGGCIDSYTLYEKGEIVGKIVLQDGWLLDIKYAIILRPVKGLGF